MILTKEVETKWSPTTKDHYIERGYTFTKHRDTFLVKVKDLTSKSSVLVEVECDYCKKIQLREYGVIQTSIINSIINKYSCKDCKGLKAIEQNTEKQKRGFLQRGDGGFWNVLENRINEFNLYMRKYGTIDGIRSKDSSLYESIVTYDKSLRGFVEIAGYEWDNVSSVSSTNYYKDFNNVELKLQEFINSNNRFPLWEEITRTLKIQIRDISFHGGLDEIKRKMNYTSDRDFIDDRGFNNKSRIEFIVAQYLIKNNIEYKRDEYPFNDRKFTCDFYIEEKNGEAIYIEVWGFKDRDDGIIGSRYRASKEIKKSLYAKNKLNLISVNYEDIERLTFDEIQEYLKSKLSNLKEKDFVIFENSSFMQSSKISDEEILEAIMKLSDNESQLPPQRLVHQAGLSSYLKEIRKRYKGYYGFALAFNKTLSSHATVKIS